MKAKIGIVILYVLLVLTLVAAGFVEHAKGTSYVATAIYHSSWFCLLWALLCVCLVVVIFRKRLWKRAAVLLLHLSFLVILGGALTSFLTSEKGYVHLQEGVAESRFIDADDAQKQHDFPFTLTLTRFQVNYYPGTEAPSDYISHVKVSAKDGKVIENANISMNKIYAHDGYRLYQSSFDDNKRGSWLSVNYDPWGTPVTYCGYLLFALSVFLVLFSRREEFLRLLRHPLLRGGAGVVLFFLCSFPVAARRTLPAFSRDKADSLSTKQVIYNDRVVPFNTLARDFVLKLTGEENYGGLTPEQVVSGWMLRPDAWRNEPMLQIKNKELRTLLGVEGKRACLADLFDQGEYKLNRYYQGGAPDASQSALQKAIIELDEKVGLLQMLRNGTLIKERPKNVPALSPAKVQAELLYNKVNFAKWLFMFNLALGFLSLFPIPIFRRRNPLPYLLYLSTALMTFTYALRWYIAGRVPLSNGYETMLFMALCISLIACFLHRRFSQMLSFGLLLSGFALLVAHIGQMNPQITPLVPVLVSPWLSAHVSLVMVAYSLFALIFFNGITGLCRPRESERLMLLSRLLLYPAVFLLGIGIFLGAVWANVSWGSYWTWDPKEVWALITFMVYGAAFHSASLPFFSHPKHFHLFTIIAFLTVLMTYFGVNYILGGMHSYAN